MVWVWKQKRTPLSNHLTTTFGIGTTVWGTPFSGAIFASGRIETV